LGRLDLLPVPTRLIQYLDRLSLCFYSVALAHLNDYRKLSESLLAYSRVLDHRGQHDQARRLRRDVDRLAVRMGAQSDMIIELLVAQAIRYHVLGYKEVISKELGQAQAAEAARRQRMEEYEFYNRLWSAGRPEQAASIHMGILESVVTPALPQYEFNMKAVRVTEQFVFAQLAMLVLLVVVVLLAVLLGAAVAADFLFVRKPNRGILLFVGWRRLGRICLLAVVVPLAVYAGYSFIAAAGGAGGLTLENGDRLVLEFVTVGSAVLAALLWMSYCAIRQRGRELGLTAPSPITWRDRKVTIVLAAILAMVIVGYLAGWWAGYFRRAPGDHPDAMKPGHWLSLAVAGMLLLHGLREWVAGLQTGRAFNRFRGSWRRSLILILAASVIVIGVGLGGMLAVGEGYAISRMGKGMPMPDEITHSDFRLLQERFVEMDKAYQAQEAARADKPGR
ncbi:MAG: hypothetical protein MUP47_02695, partial [Phycisphaerae bacterium]|nr:hypothetical protein [Phycisphaerae bacterium]